jgi:hypothetical protein
MDSKIDDRQRTASVTQKHSIVGGPYDGEPREVLDGTVTRKAAGWHAQTDVGEPREMFVPFTMAADDPVGALVLCGEQGLLREKLNRMSPGLADVVYFAHDLEGRAAVVTVHQKRSFV